MAVIFSINRNCFCYKLTIFAMFSIILVCILNSLEILFHLLHNKRCNQEKIDIVYTWVNGSDPKFLHNLQTYLKRHDDIIGASKQRFDDKHELKFSLRSLEKYASWFNHVFIVTNGQIPHWLNMDYEKVTLITHEQIFEDSFNLPSFSSPAIEKNLHKIPGLSDRFIYLNDDMFFGQDVFLEDLYSDSQGYQIYLAWPVPNCAPDCPWMYVHDDQCDKACNNFNCQFDGGDCLRYPEKETEKAQVINLKQNALSFLNIQMNKTKSFRHFGLRNLTNAVNEHNSKVLRKEKLKRIRKRKYNKQASSNNTKPCAYSASLQRTNRLLNDHFGFKIRRVPAHAPVVIDKSIMNELQASLKQAFDRTERNRVRAGDDVQFSFSYYYYIISKKLFRTVGDIFDMFDTDSSRTWSDREIRTLLAKLYELPLSYAVVDHFEAILSNCSKLSETESIPTPLYERYLDSKLPTISKNLVETCKPLSEILIKSFGQYPKYKHQISESKHVTFKMLSSNISDIVVQLDDIRSNPKKFICLNDDLDETKETENELVRAILFDFYMALFPKPSKFELPENYINKFTHYEDLQNWKNSQFKARILIIILIICLVYCLMINVLKRNLRQAVNKLL